MVDYLSLLLSFTFYTALNCKTAVGERDISRCLPQIIIVNTHVHANNIVVATAADGPSVFYVSIVNLNIYRWWSFHRITAKQDETIIEYYLSHMLLFAAVITQLLIVLNQKRCVPYRLVVLQNSLSVMQNEMDKRMDEWMYKTTKNKERTKSYNSTWFINRCFANNQIRTSSCTHEVGALLWPYFLFIFPYILHTYCTVSYMFMLRLDGVYTRLLSVYFTCFKSAQIGFSSMSAHARELQWPSCSLSDNGATRTHVLH